jgi:hypothetical protein
MSKLANVSIASEDPHRSKCLVNCFNAGPTISVMPFEGFPCVLKPPVNADLIGYNIGNIVTNHKTAFFCVDQSQGLKSARTPDTTTTSRVSDIMKASLLRRAALKIVTTIIYYFFLNEKNEKCLEFPDLARKLIRKTV